MTVLFLYPRKGRSGLEPVLDGEPRDTRELAHVRGDDCKAMGERVGRDQHVVRSDGGSLSGELPAEARVVALCRCLERYDFQG